MSAICKLNSNNKYYIFTKGAPEIVIEYCSKYIDKNNDIVPIDDKFKKDVDDIISNFASHSLRTILICYQ